ncbi:DinB family protein [bacterium]|nr:DinB family protein [bacterium]
MTKFDLIQLFRINYSALQMNVKDISDAESLILPGGKGGNCLNWVVGHITQSRNITLDLLKEEPVIEPKDAEIYKRGEHVDSVEDLMPFTEIMNAFNQSQKALLTALDELSDDSLNRPVKEGEESTLEQQLSFLNFHEAYHIGQTGLLRRIIGKDCAIP